MAKFSKTDERAAWTAFITGEEILKPSKYKNQRAGRYASKHEAEIALRLHALERSGEIRDLKEQVPFTLVEGTKLVPGIVYIADFVYTDRQGTQHILDAKGVRTGVYKLKKRLAALLKGITIEET